MSRVWSPFLLAALIAGCFDTSATVPFAVADASIDDTSVPTDDVAPDTDDDGATPPDLADDTGPLYPRDTLPRGTTCAGVPTEPPQYECNPVLQDCARVEVCEIQILPTGFAANCRRRGAAETFDIADGASCDTASDTQHCRAGARCLAGVCRALCEFADAVGCTAQERCEAIDDAPGPGGDILEGYGICLSTCR